MKAKETIAPVSQHHIAPQTGVAFTVQKGQIIRVIDVDGEQVADLVCFARQDTQEYLSSGRSIDYNETLFLSTGDILYSNRSNPMLAITQDQVGKHDLLFAPCSQEMFQLTYSATEPHPNCLDNLAAALDPCLSNPHGIQYFHECCGNRRRPGNSPPAVVQSRQLYRSACGNGFDRRGKCLFRRQVQQLSLYAYRG